MRTGGRGIVSEATVVPGEDTVSRANGEKAQGGAVGTEFQGRQGGNGCDTKPSISDRGIGLPPLCDVFCAKFAYPAFGGSDHVGPKGETDGKLPWQGGPPLRYQECAYGQGTHGSQPAVGQGGTGQEAGDLPIPLLASQRLGRCYS